MKPALSVGIVTENVSFSGDITPCYRAVLTTPQGEVVDQSGLFSDREECERHGAELLRLYNEKGQTREKVLGYITPAALEGMTSEDWDSCGVSKHGDSRSTIPVYIKIGDYLSTMPVSK